MTISRARPRPRADRAPAPVVRRFEPRDAEAVCDLYNATAWGPAAYGYLHRPSEILRGLDESGTLVFFVADAGDGEIVGTLSCLQVSSQKACPHDAMWGDNFVVAPAYRSSALAGHLAMAAMEFAVANGYMRVHANVEADNTVAHRLYRRAGGRRLDPGVCVDGCIELVNFVPYVLRYLMNVLVPDQKDHRPALNLLGAGFVRGLSSGGDRTTAVDAFPWGGTTVVEYTLPLPTLGLTKLLVDVSTTKVCSLECDLFAVSLRAAAETGTATVEVENRADSQAGVKVTAAGSAPRFLARRRSDLAPGAAVSTPVRNAFPGAGYAVTVTTRGRSFTLPLVLGGVGGGSGEGHDRAARRDPGAGTLESPWLNVRIDPSSAALEIVDAPSGEVLIRELCPDVGPPFPGGYKRPLERDVRRVATGDPGIVVETPANSWRVAAVSDPDSPVRSFEGLTVRRRITFVTDQVTRVDTTLVNRRRVPLDADGLQLRLFPWALGTGWGLSVPLRDGLLRAPVVYRVFPFLENAFEHLRSTDLPSDPGEFAAPWSAFTRDGRVAGCIWPGASEVRFGLQWMPSVLYDVPGVPAGSETALPPHFLVGGPGDESTVAAVWELLRKTGEAGSGPDPGEGSASVAPVTRRLPVELRTEVEDAPAEAWRLKGTIEHCGGSSRGGELEVSADRAATVTRRDSPGTPARFEVLVPGSEDRARLGECAIGWTEPTGTTEWRVPLLVRSRDRARVERRPNEIRISAQGGFGCRIATDTANLQQLSYGGKEWVRRGRARASSAAERPTFFTGDGDAAARGGFADAGPDGVSGSRWEGAALEGPRSSDGVRHRVRYLAAHGAPLFVAEASYENAGPRALQFDAGFSLRLLPGVGRQARCLHELGDATLSGYEDVHCFAAGRDGAIVSDDEDHLVVIGPGSREVRVTRVGKSWDVSIVTPLALSPGQHGRMQVILVRDDVRRDVGWYLDGLPVLVPDDCET